MKYLVILYISILSSYAYAQLHDADTWYFGDYCGISFNTPNNIPIALNNSAMKTDEGSAVMSDWTGELLFYTDGTTVWNRFHVQMPNGDNLEGHSSSTQSAIVVQQPRSDHLYYIFTVDRQGKFFGLKYSIADMALDETKGDITDKNIPLHGPVSEKISAVKHKNGKDVWILAHE